MRNRLLSAVVLWWALAAPALAQLSPKTVDQFQHSRWTTRDGGPWGINAIAQSPDGFIWLATPTGLMRFDGVAFQAFAPPGDDPASAPTVVAVLTRRSGEVWVGLGGFAGVAALREGRLVDMGLPDPAYQVTSLVEDLDGDVWASTTRAGSGLRRYRQGRWETIDARWNAPSTTIPGDLIVDKAGSLWVALDKSLYVLPRGAKRFVRTDVPATGGVGYAVDAAGRLWIADTQGVRRVPDILGGETAKTPQPTYRFTGVRRGKIMFSPDGSLWGATWTNWLFRIQTPGQGGEVSRYKIPGGRASDDFGNVFVDRDGTAWFGGAGGLDSFVATGLFKEPVFPFSPEGYQMAADGQGRVYLVTGDEAFVIRPGASPQRIMKDEFLGVCRGRNGSVWLTGPNLFRRVVDGKVVKVLRSSTTAIGNCAEDPQGRLWWVDEGGTIRVQDGAVTRDMSRLLPEAGDEPWETFSDRQGRPIFLLENRAIARVDGARSDIWTNQRLGVGAIIDAVEDGPSGLFIAGSAGLARIRGDKIQRLQVRRHPWLRGARAITWSPDGHVLMLSRAGLVRLKAADLDRAFDQPDAPIPHSARADLDGLSPGHRRYGGPQAAFGGDGRYWFLAGLGPMMVQPGGLTPNRTPPPVIIRSISHGGRVYDASAPIVLPKGAKNLSIAYSALSLRAPSQTQFRYKLDGVDADWVDPGARREAIYTNLAPGQHRFQVIAANEDGVWNNTGATLEFTIPKTFVQTQLFLALCVLALAALVRLAFSLRLRAVSERIRLRMGERMAERERIARELHDTLLQGVQVLILRLQLIANQTARQGDGVALERILDEADTFVAEARDRVWDLRASPAQGDLEAALDTLVEAASTVSPCVIHRHTEGKPRPLEPTACDEIVRIVHEAVANAQRHAHASSIRIVTVYRPFSLEVSIADDGIGMSPQILRDGRDGHFGLKGMHERARRIEGRVRIDSKASAGVRVTLKAPGGVVYESGSLRWLKTLNARALLTRR